MESTFGVFQCCIVTNVDKGEKYGGNVIRQIEMVWFVDPSEPGILSPRHQRLQGIIDVPEFNKSLGFSQFLLMPVSDSTPVA
jgi:hypothetical protein